jgi:hypothetical protein
MARIFLCHANEDKPQVEELYDRLRALGFEPWMDKRALIPGQRWQWEIPRALKASALVLVCLSKNIGRPGYVQREFKLAVDALQEIPDEMIHTIPVRLDPCNVPEQFSELVRSKNSCGLQVRILQEPCPPPQKCYLWSHRPIRSINGQLNLMSV